MSAATAGVLPRWTSEPLPGSKDAVSWRWSTLGARHALLVSSSVREARGLAPLVLAAPAVSSELAEELVPGRGEDVQAALRGACRELLAVQLRAWSAKALDARWRPREDVEESLDSPVVAERVEAVLEAPEVVLAELPALPEVVGVRSVDLAAYGLESAMLACSDSTAERGGLTVVAVIAVPGAVRRELLDLGAVDGVAAWCESVGEARGVPWTAVAGALLGGAAALGVEVRPRG